MLRTSFVPAWTSKEATQFREEEYKKLTKTVISTLQCGEAIKANFSYNELMNLEYPDFVFIRSYIKSTYDEMMEKLNEARGTA